MVVRVDLDFVNPVIPLDVGLQFRVDFWVTFHTLLPLFHTRNSGGSGANVGSNCHRRAGRMQWCEWKGALAVISDVGMRAEVIEFFRSHIQPVKIWGSHDLVVLERLGNTDEGFVTLSDLVGFDAIVRWVIFKVNKSFNRSFFKRGEQGMVIHFMLT